MTHPTTDLRTVYADRPEGLEALTAAREVHFGEDANKLLASLLGRDRGTYKVEVLARAARGPIIATQVEMFDFGGPCWGFNWDGGYCYVNPDRIITARLRSS